MKEQQAIKILLIEDNLGDARLIRDMLEDAQYQSFSLYHAETLSEGSHMLSDGQFNVVLLDIGLPDSMGIDSIKAIKDCSPEVPIIMMTGLDNEETAITSLKMGAQDYLVKGQVDTGLLLRSIRYAIERNNAAADIESKQRFIQHVADTTPDILYILDISDHSLVYSNKALRDVLGYSVEEINLFGDSLYHKLVYSEDLNRVLEYGERLYSANDDKILNLECRMRHRDGRWRWMDFRSVVFSRGKDGSTKEILGTAHDITDRKETEERIRASLLEKELLLREIHHRVKNNMTVIFSMLKLQSRHVKDEHYRSMFHDSMSRIKSMALVHEKLYRSGNLAAVNFGAYLKDLANNLFMFYKISADRVRLRTEVADITLGIDTAIPCGLIVSELVSNAMKHAFREDETGEITVSLREIADAGTARTDASFRHDPTERQHEESGSSSPDTGIELTVSDNGSGIPADIEISQSKSMGLNLVNALVKQLHGTIEVNRKKGTEFRVRFRI
ncbi:MAG: histidine kinase dimerization/phosphoacceptor domain -containing protein [Nitrospirota bacterium]